LLPLDQIKEREGLYESTGSDPQFELKSNKKNLPRRWVFISYRAEYTDDVFSPTIFYSKGEDYHEGGAIRLSHMFTESRLVRLPYNLKSLRMDPADKSDLFRLSDVRFLEVGFIPLLLILSWRELAHDLKRPNVFISKILNGVGYLLAKGPASARDVLTDRHQMRSQKRIVSDYKTAPHPVAPNETQWQKLIEKIQHGRNKNVKPCIDVIIPVYKGYEETLNCIYQALNEQNNTVFELIVINDSSPDASLSIKLRELSGQGLFALRENKINKGFVRTVNIGMGLHRGRDVVLLNSDTEVYNNWLDRMHNAAYKEKNIGTVTPFSNNAEICSYPYNVQENNMQLELPYSELDLISAEVNNSEFVQIPTGIGFCMYIRRDCLNEVGLFDEESFGKGYGEENDFCLMAVEKGWKNILAADTFVRHIGGSSFGADKQDRVINAIRVINDRFPGYDQKIQDFLYEDPIQVYRKNIDVGRLNKEVAGKVFLVISHNWGGGTEKHIQDMAAKLGDEGVRIYYLRPHLETNLVATISCPDMNFMPNLPVLDLLNGSKQNASIIKELGITHVHIHSLVGFSDRIIASIPKIMGQAGLQYDVTLHDYMTICPRVHLSDDRGIYCGEPIEVACDNCIKRHGTSFGEVEIRSWKKRNHALLQGARKVFVPNDDVIERMKRYYPDLVYTLRPHPEPDVNKSQRVRSFGKPVEPISVGVIGAIGPHKGSYLLQRCAKDAHARDLPIEYVVIGYTNIAELANAPNVTVTGEYDEADVYELIKKHRIHVAFFPATWPETYSYTLSLALRAGLKPVAFDFGAIADRMKWLGYEELLIPFSQTSSPGDINDFLLESNEACPELHSTGCGFIQYKSLTRDYYAFE